MKRYSIYCTESQVKQAFELGAPIIADTQEIKFAGRNGLPFDIDRVVIPTTEQMLCWLEEQGLRFMIGSKQDNYDCISYGCVIRHKDSSDVIYIKSHITSRKEVTIAAIDAALDYLIKERNK